MPSPVPCTLVGLSPFAYTAIGEPGTRGHQDRSRYCHPVVTYPAMKHGSKMRSGIKNVSSIATESIFETERCTLQMSMRVEETITLDISVIVEFL